MYGRRLHRGGAPRVRQTKPAHGDSRRGGGELNRNWYETDIRSMLPSVKVPTLLLDPGHAPT